MAESVVKGTGNVNYSEDISTIKKIYLLMEQNLAEVNEDMPFTMDAACAYASEGRGEIDYLKLINLDNHSFFDATYMIAFNTLPPTYYIDRWRTDIETLPKEEFHRKFINSFVQLPDFGKRHVRLRNCICLDVPEKNGDRKPVKKTIKEQIFRILKPIYLKFPQPIRNELKKLLWGYFAAQ